MASVTAGGASQSSWWQDIESFTKTSPADEENIDREYNKKLAAIVKKFNDDVGTSGDITGVLTYHNKDFRALQDAVESVNDAIEGNRSLWAKMIDWIRGGTEKVTSSPIIRTGLFARLFHCFERTQVFTLPVFTLAARQHATEKTVDEIYTSLFSPSDFKSPREEIQDQLTRFHNARTAQEKLDQPETRCVIRNGQFYSVYSVSDAMPVYQHTGGIAVLEDTDFSKSHVIDTNTVATAVANAKKFAAFEKTCVPAEVPEEDLLAELCKYVAEYPRQIHYTVQLKGTDQVNLYYHSASQEQPYKIQMTIHPDWSVSFRMDGKEQKFPTIQDAVDAFKSQHPENHFCDGSDIHQRVPKHRAELVQEQFTTAFTGYLVPDLGTLEARKDACRKSDKPCAMAWRDAATGSWNVLKYFAARSGGGSRCEHAAYTITPVAPYNIEKTTIVEATGQAPTRSRSVLSPREFIADIQTETSGLRDYVNVWTPVVAPVVTPAVAPPLPIATPKEIWQKENADFIARFRNKEIVSQSMMEENTYNFKLLREDANQQTFTLNVRRGTMPETYIITCPTVDKTPIKTTIISADGKRQEMPFATFNELAGFLGLNKGMHEFYRQDQELLTFFKNRQFDDYRVDSVHSQQDAIALCTGLSGPVSMIYRDNNGSWHAFQYQNGKVLKDEICSDSKTFKADEFHKLKGYNALLRELKSAQDAAVKKLETDIRTYANIPEPGLKAKLSAGVLGVLGFVMGEEQRPLAPSSKADAEAAIRAVQGKLHQTRKSEAIPPIFVVYEENKQFHVMTLAYNATFADDKIIKVKYSSAAGAAVLSLEGKPEQQFSTIYDLIGSHCKGYMPYAAAFAESSAAAVAAEQQAQTPSTAPVTTTTTTVSPKQTSAKATSPVRTTTTQPSVTPPVAHFVAPSPTTGTASPSTPRLGQPVARPVTTPPTTTPQPTAVATPTITPATTITTPSIPTTPVVPTPAASVRVGPPPGLRMPPPPGIAPRGDTARKAAEAKAQAAAEAEALVKKQAEAEQKAAAAKILETAQPAVTDAIRDVQKYVGFSVRNPNAKVRGARNNAEALNSSLSRSNSLFVKTQGELGEDDVYNLNMYTCATAFSLIRSAPPATRTRAAARGATRLGTEELRTNALREIANKFDKLPLIEQALVYYMSSQMKSRETEMDAILEKIRTNCHEPTRQGELPQLKAFLDAKCASTDAAERDFYSNLRAVLGETSVPTGT